MSRIGIVGAGMVGLSAAYRLCKAGHDVTVFERDNVPGGLAASFAPVPGCDPLERFYHHIFQSDRRMIQLIRELGLQEELVWCSPRTVCLFDGKLERLDSLRSLMMFKPLTPPDRIRLAFALGTLKAVPSHRPLQKYRSARWLRRVAGSDAYTAVFEPLFRSKFGEHAEDVSLAWFWARIHDRTTKLGYVRGGFTKIYEALANGIRSAGGDVRLSSPVRCIEAAAGGVRVDANGVSGTFDRVIATVPLRILAQLARDLPQSFVQKYAPESGLAARCVVLALNQPLTDAYWINICQPGLPFMVVVEHTNLISPSRYGGRHLIYLGNYGKTFPNVPVEQILEEFEPHLRRLNPGFRLDWVTGAWQFVGPDAQPIVTTSYHNRIAPYQTPVPGLFSANIYQVYPHDRGQNYAIELAGACVSEMALTS